MIRIERDPGDPVVKIECSGKVRHTDYVDLVPRLEAAIEESGPIRVLIELKDFRGWEPQAAWDELKFDVRHRADFERVAVIGDKAWQSWGLTLSKPFFDAEMRFFEPKDAADARTWLHAA